MSDKKCIVTVCDKNVKKNLNVCEYHNKRLYDYRKKGINPTSDEDIIKFFKDLDDGIYKTKNRRPRKEIVYDEDGTKIEFLSKLNTFKQKLNHTHAYDALVTLSQWEKIYNKPFYKIPPNDLVKAIVDTKSDSGSKLLYNTLKIYFATLNVYANWVCPNELKVDKYFTKLVKKYDVANSIKDNDIIQMLRPTREIFFEQLDMSQLYIRDKTVIALTYEGLTAQDILNLEESACLNLDTHQLKCSKIIYENISEKTLGYIKDCISQTLISGRFADKDKKYLIKRYTTTNDERTEDLIKTALEKYRLSLKKINKDMLTSIRYMHLNGAYHNLICKEKLYNKIMTIDEIKSELDKYIVVEYVEKGNNTYFYEAELFTRFKKYYKDEILNTNMIKPKEIIDTTSVNYELHKTEAPKNRTPFTPSERDDDALENPIGTENLLRGKLGEMWILKKLQILYGGENNAYKVKDNCGFDIEVIKDGIPFSSNEIKVVTNFTNAINITFHELEIATKRQDMYKIYIVAISREVQRFDEMPENTEFIRITNPVKKFDIDIDDLEDRFEMSTQKCKIKADSCKITNWNTQENIIYKEIPI